MAPSALRANTQTFTADGFAPVSEPRALESAEIPEVIAQYVDGAARAKAAGFDGVEVHGANGYLIDQFLRDGANKRDDAYGGSPASRVRFLREVVEGVAGVFGAGRVGVRLSPTGQFNDMSDSDVGATFTEAVRQLNEMGLAYLHMVETFPGENSSTDDQVLLDRLAEQWSGVYIANGGFDADRAAEWIGRGRADAIAFGRPFISNPDPPEDRVAFYADRMDAVEVEPGAV